MNDLMDRMRRLVEAARPWVQERWAEADALSGEETPEVGAIDRALECQAWIAEADAVIAEDDRGPAR